MENGNIVDSNLGFDLCFHHFIWFWKFSLRKRWGRSDNQSKPLMLCIHNRKNWKIWKSSISDSWTFREKYGLTSSMILDNNFTILFLNFPSYNIGVCYTLYDYDIHLYNAKCTFICHTLKNMNYQIKLLDFNLILW
jgi:hypothetical protein